MSNASAPAGGPIIEVSGITKTYGEGQAAFQALRGVDFAVGRGNSSR
jgi:putative ABC transport system ATP-binding protein